MNQLATAVLPEIILTLCKGSDLTARLPFVIRDGWVALEYAPRNGARQLIALFLPGETVPDLPLGSWPSQSQWTALTTVSFMRTEEQALVKLARTDYHRRNAEHILLLERRARSRAAGFLLDLHDRLHRTHYIGGRDVVGIPISQEVAGLYLGLSNVHLNKTFSEFRREGILKMSGMFYHLLDIPRLREIAEV